MSKSTRAADPSFFKRKQKRVYKFCPNKIKYEPLKFKRPSEFEALCSSMKYALFPEPRSGHRIVVYSGNVYAFGGYNPGNHSSSQGQVLFRELWRFNCASRTWSLLTTIGKMPSELASHCALLLNNNMLVFGGTGIPFGETSSNSTHFCNLDTLEWSTLETSGMKPLEQYGQAMTVHENKMYVVGGTTGYEYSMDVHCLDLETKEWSLLQREPLIGQQEEPPARYRHEIAVENDQLLVFGGGTATANFDFKRIPVFSLKDHTWKFIPTSDDCPSARKCHGCVQIGSDVYICGGHDGEVIYKDVWRINLRQLQWEKLSATLIKPVYFHSCAISNEGQLFIFGGVTSIEANTRTNALFSMWVKIPSLASMCWQAVLYYIPHIASLEKQKLFQAGVPMCFLNQVEFQSPRNMQFSTT